MPNGISNIEGGIIKLQVYLVIVFIIFLVLVVIGGSILANLNKAGCQTDVNMLDAKKWVKWFLGISVVGMLLALIAFIALFFVEA